MGPKREAVTPAAELRAPGVDGGKAMEAITMRRAGQQMPMRTISNHEQDTPHILHSHVSIKKAYVVSIGLCMCTKLTTLYDDISTMHNPWS